MTNRVEHPDYYQGKNGIETIEIIRHYTCDIANALKYLMRAGKKQEMGMEDAEKEIEDLKKALWYIEDYKKHVNKHSIYTTCKAPKESEYTDKEICEFQIQILSGHLIGDITKGYDKAVATAMHYLLQVGVISEEGKIFMPRTWRYMLDEAIKAIRQRILDIQYLSKSQWKPSDEQMLAVNTAINVIGKGTLTGKLLIELYEDLKKLR